MNYQLPCELELVNAQLEIQNLKAELETNEDKLEQTQMRYVFAIRNARELYQKKEIESQQLKDTIVELQMKVNELENRPPPLAYRPPTPPPPPKTPLIIKKPKTPPPYKKQTLPAAVIYNCLPTLLTMC